MAERTKHDVEHWMADGKTTIPKGTGVEKATNLPKGNAITHWANPWKGMSAAEKSHQRTYGFGVGKADVETIPTRGTSDGHMVTK